MKIENNILKHYLKNVYFITGTAYAGKSTAVRMLAKQYGVIECGENYHMPIQDLMTGWMTTTVLRENFSRKRSSR